VFIFHVQDIYTLQESRSKLHIKCLDNPDNVNIVLLGNNGKLNSWRVIAPFHTDFRGVNVLFEIMTKP
jgi:hypothetical protein